MKKLLLLLVMPILAEAMIHTPPNHITQNIGLSKSENAFKDMKEDATSFISLLPQDLRTETLKYVATHELLKAIHTQNIQAMEKAIAAGANLNIMSQRAGIFFGSEESTNKQAQAPLITVILSHGHYFGNEQLCFKIAELLLKSGAPIDAKGYNGETALKFFAAYSGIVTLLLKHGANPNVMDNDGHTPLDADAWFSCTDLLRAAGGKTGIELRAEAH